MFIIDLDNTLMDTAGSFKDARVKSLEDLGVDRKLYEKSYLEARNGEDGLSIYSSKRHAKVLGNYGHDEKIILEKLDETIKSEKIKKHFYPDTINFLDNLKKLNQKMILLTLGNPEFQENKIKALGLKKYFDRVILTNQPKEIKLKEILDTISERPAWFINDRIVENLAAAKFVGVRVLQTMFKLVPKEEYQESGLPYFENLTEIYEYIKQQSK